MLNDYIVHINYMYFTEIVASVACVVGLVTVLIDVIPVWIGRVVFGVSLAFTAYALKQISSAVTAMNDLVWQAAFFESNKPSAGQTGSNVVRHPAK